jgi:tetraacyldisaccharide 4'-kinase
MAGREPSWWYGDPSWKSLALAPIAKINERAVEARFKRAVPFRAERPVICVGNFTAGGTGKTPMALLVADLIAEAGGAPWFLSRGYGGRLDGQELVDPSRHTAAEVGDEPLILAAHAPTVISRNRALGAEFIARQAPRNAVIVMDDGMQNPSLAKDLTIALIDGNRGVGNGFVIPAGPLRAGLNFQLALASLIIVTGGESTTARRYLDGYPASRPLQKLSAVVAPRGNAAWISGERVVAFAGIANPDRFFSLVTKLGGDVVGGFAYPDHQTLSIADAKALLAAQQRTGALLVTTEKDYVRLNGLDGARRDVQKIARPLPIAFSMTEGDRSTLSARIREVMC